LRGHQHVQSTRQPTRAVDEHDVARPASDAAGDLCGREQRDREHPRDRPIEGRGLGRDVHFVREEPICPGALVPQWRAVHHHRVARSEPADSRTHRSDGARSLHAQGHRRPDAHVPVAGPHQVFPVADARREDVDQDLAIARSGRVRKLELLDRSSEDADAGGLHAVSIAKTGRIGFM
jgi:hypothetical protein